MKSFTLQRFVPTAYGTFGEWRENGGAFEAFTVERPWLDNQPFVSCIPDGTYPLQRFHSSRFGHVWMVCEVPNRSSILIHPANWPSDVEGCIGLGKEIGELLEKKAILNSSSKIQEFHLLMTGQTEGMLTIMNAPEEMA
jgi:Family of unknown function (DUF5675)